MLLCTRGYPLNNERIYFGESAVIIRLGVEILNPQALHGLRVLFSPAAFVASVYEAAIRLFF